jgi:hypothetical protein
MRADQLEKHMGAAHQSRRAGDRERRLLRQVDPELAAKLDEMDLERAQRRAQQLRRHLGMDKPKREPKPLTPGQGLLVLAMVLWLAVFVTWIITYE